MKPIILDPNGRLVTSKTDAYRNGNLTNLQEFSPAYKNNHLYDHWQKSNQNTRDTLGSLTEGLAFNNSLVKSALKLYTRMAFGSGLQVRYAGPNKAWGNLAEERIRIFDMNPSMRGKPFNQGLCSKIRYVETFCNGGVLTPIVIHPATGEMKTQLIRIGRVRNRNEWIDNKRITKDVPLEVMGIGEDGTTKTITINLKGRKCIQGVALDDFDAPLAYHICGDLPADDRWIPAQSVIHSWNPEWATQIHGIPETHASSRELMTIDQAKQYELESMRNQSKRSIVERNERGAPLPASRLSLSPTEEVEDDSGNMRQVKTDIDRIEIPDGGGIVEFFKANTGSGIEMLMPDRPGNAYQEFIKTLLVIACGGMDVDADVLMSLREPGGNWSRAVLFKFNLKIADIARQEAETLLPIHVRLLLNSIALGQLPPPPSLVDLTNFVYRLTVKRMTGDIGREVDAQLKKYAAGQTSLLEICSEDSNWWEDTRDQLDEEFQDAFIRARKNTVAFPELSFDDHLRMFGYHDRLGIKSASQVTVDGDEDGEGAGDNIDTEIAKQEMDAYGVGVRAGAITPNVEDENHFRAKLKLPAKNANVDRAWSEDKGVRRPITLVHAGGAAQPGNPPQQPEEDDE